MEQRDIRDTPNRGAVKPRKFFKMARSVRGGGAVGLKLLNEDLLVRAGKRRTLGPDPGTRGFPIYPEPPHFLLDRRLGRDVQDIETYTAYWLISDRMKRVLESIDPAGFAFCKCKTELRNGEEGPPYWLCDVLRVLDAIDEEKSRIFVKYESTGKKIYLPSLGNDCVFKKKIVENIHIFRLTFLELRTICDEKLKLACKAQNLKGIEFSEVGIEQ